MKQELTIVAAAPSPDLLLRIAQALRKATQSIEVFVWSALPGDTEIRVWLVLPDLATSLPQLVIDLETIPEVSRVLLHPPRPEDGASRAVP